MSHKTGRVAGKVAIISGGAMGMGEAHARKLVGEGAKVVIGDIAQAEGRALSDELGDQAMFVHLDVVSAADWAGAVEAAEQSFGPVNVLVNNAGIVELALLGEVSEAAFRRVLDVNLIGPFLGMTAVLPSMKKAGGGSIINISSAAGLAPIKNIVSYVASKYAVRGLSRAAALDFEDYNIRVNSVHPGNIATRMSTGGNKLKSQAIKRKGRPEEIANMVLFLASDEASYCTGSEYIVDGGFLSVVGSPIGS